MSPNDQDIVLGPLDDTDVDRGKALRRHLIGELDRALEGQFRSEFACHQITGAGADAVTDLVARHDEVFAEVVMAGDDDVGVRMPGVEVVDGGPVELGVQIAFHSLHQIAHEGA